MAVTQTSQIVFKLLAQLQGSDAISALVDAVTADYTQNFGNGTGANQAAEIYHAAAESVAASGSKTYVLGNSSLADKFGNLLALTRVVALIIRASAANANTVKVGNAGVNPWAPMFDAATDVVTIRPGGALVLIAPDATGYAVAAGSSEQLKVANGGAGTAVVYDIVVIGN